MRKMWIRLKASSMEHNLFPRLQHSLWIKLNTRLFKRVKAQAELKVAAKILKRDEHKAEKQVEREAA